MINDYCDVTNVIYKQLHEQFDVLAEEIKHIKTIKMSLILEYIVVILITLFSNDPKLPKGAQNQFKTLNHYVHQNILLLIAVIIDKLPHKEDAKEWRENLQTIIDSKLSQMAVKATGLNNKQQSKLEIMKNNCDNIIPLVKSIISKKPMNASRKGK